MEKNLTYKGFEAKIGYCEKEKEYVGAVIGSEDFLYFSGKSKEELEHTFHQCVNDYLKAKESCDHVGRQFVYGKGSVIFFGDNNWKETLK